MNADGRGELIDRLLAGARDAVVSRDWDTVIDLVDDVLILDPQEPDAMAMRSLAQRHAERAGMPAGRRHETVLFADLVASTELVDRFDPELVHQLTRDYELACTPVLVGLGGHIHRFVGDGILASFGYPTAHEDDAVRAVQAALDLVRAVAGIAKRHRAQGADLQVRVGIASGILVHGDRGSHIWSQPGDLFGPAVNLAARLHELAPPGGICISADTAALLGGRFELEAAGPRQLKGFAAPVEVHRVVRALDTAPRRGPGSASPFVGRRDELRELEDLWTEASDPRSPSSPAVLVWGEPGVGKSRLVHELLAATTVAERSEVEVRCSAQRAASPLHPVRVAIERVCAIEQEDDDDTRLAKLRATIARTLDPDEVLVYFALLLELDIGGRLDRPELTSTQLREVTLSHLHRWVTRVAARSPSVLVVEDLHWADPSTEDLLRRVVQSRPPGLLTVATTRNPPDERSDLGRHALHLQPLSSSESRELAERLGADLSPSVTAEVALRSDGIPLFVEQLADSLTREDDGASLTVPTSLAELLQSRLDAVGPSKVVAQLAATVGREFEVDTVDAMVERLVGARALEVLDRPVADHVLRLIDSNLVERDPGSDRGLRFRHALVREAAYESQLIGDRPRRHEVVARLFAEEGTEGRMADPAVVALHFDRGECPFEAMLHYLAAAERSQEMGAFAEVLTHLERATGLLARLPDEVQAGIELTICLYRGLAVSSAGGYAAHGVADDFWRAAELCEQVDDVDGGVLKAQLGLWTYYCATGALDTAQVVSTAMTVQLDRGVRLAGGQAGFHACHGVEHFFKGELDDAREQLGIVVGLMGVDDIDPKTWPLPNDPFAASLGFVGPLRLIGGDEAGALAAIAAGVERSEALTFPLGPFSLAFVRTYEAWMQRVRGDVDAALVAAEEVLRIGEKFGFFDWVMTGRMNVSAAIVATRPTIDALEEMGAAIVLWRSVGGNILLPSILLEQAHGYLALGDTDRATARLADAIDLADQGQRLSYAGIHRLRAELRATTDGPDHPDVAAHLVSGIRFAQRQGAPLFVTQVADAADRLVGRDALPGEVAAAVAAARAQVAGFAPEATPSLELG